MSSGIHSKTKHLADIHVAFEIFQQGCVARVLMFKPELINESLFVEMFSGKNSNTVSILTPLSLFFLPCVNYFEQLKFSLVISSFYLTCKVFRSTFCIARIHTRKSLFRLITTHQLERFQVIPILF